MAKAKILIAQNPTFSAPVMVPRVGGEPIKVEFKFKYLDRKALAAMFARWDAARKALVAQVEEKQSIEDITAAEIDMQVDQVKDIVSGWGFDDKFSEDAIVELVTTCVGAPTAIIDAYQAAYASARLGN